MIELSFDKIKALHHLLAAETGGPVAMKDEGLLTSAIEEKFETVDGHELYPTIEEKAAKLGHSIIVNHAYFDGNMRLGMLAMLTLLEVNGIKLSCSNDDIAKAGKAVKAGKMSYEQLRKWIEKHKPIE